MPARKRSGFTLLELIVAITLCAGMLVAGRALLDQMTAAVHGIASWGATQDSTLARERTLRNLFRNLEIPSNDSTSFTGTPRSLAFASWCETSTGLRERCALTMTIDSTLAVIRPGMNSSTVLLRGAGPGSFLYLGDAHVSGSWLQSWGPGLTVPLAVAAVFGSDTTILRIGDRR